MVCPYVVSPPGTASFSRLDVGSYFGGESVSVEVSQGGFDDFPSVLTIGFLSYWNVLRLPVLCLWLVSSFLRMVAMGTESLPRQRLQDQCPACSVALNPGENIP